MAKRRWAEIVDKYPDMSAGGQLLLSERAELADLKKLKSFPVNAIRLLEQSIRGACGFSDSKRGAGMNGRILFQELGREIVAINTANGWRCLVSDEWADPYKVPAILALVHSEVSEALEAFRKGDSNNFAEELADVVIRVLDCSEGLGIDLYAQIVAKLEKNRHRGYRHGGKRV